MTSWVRNGMQVVCVNTSLALAGPPPVGFEWDDDLDGLTEGKVYTIRGAGRHPDTNHFGLYLCEIIRPLNEGDTREATFMIERFRPVKTQEADTAMFLSLLSSTDVMALAD